MTPETGFYREVAPWLRVAPLKVVLRFWRRLQELGLTPEEVAARCGRGATPGQVLGAMLELYAEGRKKPRCGEKTPLHLRYVPRIVADFPEARILCIYRDGRDAAMSLHAMPWGPRKLETAAAAWLQAVRLMQDYAEAYPGEFLPVRYEDLLEDAAGQMAMVMPFLGLEAEAGQLEAGPSGVVLGRSMEWKGKALEQVDPKLRGYRQAGASAGELERLEKILGPTLRELGYR